MRKPTKGEAVVAASLVVATGAGVGYGLYESNRGHAGQSGNQPHEAQETPDATAVRQAWEKKMDEAREARLAIAKRYAGCTIVKVEDTHTSEKREGHIAMDERGLPEPYEGVPRNKVIVTVEAAITPEAAKAEDKYAKGTPNASDVGWYPFGAGASAHVVKEDPDNPDKRFRAFSVPSASKSEKTGPNKETFTVTMYPRTDERRTTSADISLGTFVRTYDQEAKDGKGATHVAAGRLSCGTVYEDVDISDPNKLEPGPLTWQISQSPTEGLEEFVFTDQTCTSNPVLREDGTVQCD